MDKSINWKEELSADKPLFHQLKSPLRLFMLSLFAGEPDRVFDTSTLSQESSAIHKDVQACVAPMIDWKILEELKIPSGEGFRLAGGGRDGLLEAVESVLKENDITVDRYRRARDLFYGLIGEDEKMKIAFEMIRTAARSEMPVLVEGEFGTGKRLVARAIHRFSRRSNKPFVIFDCGEHSEQSFEKELLGSIRQSDKERPDPGMLAANNGGTILFFDIDRLSMSNQEALAEILKSGRFSPKGANGLILPLDIHTIFSSRKSIQEKVERGLFQEALFHQINTILIRLPSLRERRGDIPMMATELLGHYCLEKYGDPHARIFKPETLRKLALYSWPENAKQLKNVVEKASSSKKAQIGPEDIEALPEPDRVKSDLHNENESIKLIEKQHIENVLKLNNWNIKRSSERLGITRATLYKKIDQYGMKKPVK